MFSPVKRNCNSNFKQVFAAVHRTDYVTLSHFPVDVHADFFQDETAVLINYALGSFAELLHCMIFPPLFKVA